MDIHGEQLLNADKEVIWRMLNDPEVLRECIPGCEELNADAENRMNATVTVKIGPIKARFSGGVELMDLNPPTSYSIVGEGKGGVAGFARGKADVVLEEQPDGTLLKYKVDVTIGGKIAQLGGRLIESTAKKLSGVFFDRFASKVSVVTGAET